MTELPDGACLESGPGGLQRLVLRAAEGEAHIFAHGAHLTHFQPRGERPVLWMSGKSQFVAGNPGQAIRGGVPICFPWFGPRQDAPVHGVARVLGWTLEAVEAGSEGLSASFTLAANDHAARFFPGRFELRFSVTVGRTLAMALEVRNAGDAPFRFDEALHTYFAVGDARRVAVRGLEGVTYVDRMAAGARASDPGPLAIAAETDRVYPAFEGPITIEDPVWERSLVVTRSGSRSAVVWNPWIAKAQAMPDFGDDEWPGMLCVESANVLEEARTLAPGERHIMGTTLEVRRG